MHKSTVRQLIKLLPLGVLIWGVNNSDGATHIYGNLKIKWMPDGGNPFTYFWSENV